MKSKGSFAQAVGGDDPGQKISRQAQESRTRYFAALEWAQRNVPEEHGPFAASAAMTLRRATGRWPTPEQVRDRLKEQRRSKAQLEAT